MATWAAFREEVVILLAEDWQRTGLRAYINIQIRNAVVNIQQFIEEYRTGHKTVYGPDQLETKGGASIGRLPTQAYIEQFRFKTTGYQCHEFPLEPHSWDKRNDLSCCDGPLYKVAINPIGREFWVNPKVDPGSHVILHWNGRKNTWNDDDEVDFDQEVSLLVAEWVSAYLGRKVYNDESMFQAHMGNYIRMRKDLFLNVKEQKWQRAPGNQETVGSCAPGCEPYDLDTSTEWVCFGDSGDPDYISDTEAVAKLALGMQPDFITHLGDTNYPHGDPVTCFDNLIKYFTPYFRTAWYQVLGNHDYDTDIAAYLLSQLPKVQALIDESGVPYCYQFTRGLVDFFVVNTGGSGADTIDESSAIPVWLDAALDASANTWKVVFMHKPPQSSDSSYYPGVSGVDWSCLTKADAIISGHGHQYERFQIDGQPRFVVGTGGAPLRGFHSPPATGSQFRYSSKHGVLRCSADKNKLQFVFYNVDNEIIDNSTLYPTSA